MDFFDYLEETVNKDQEAVEELAFLAREDGITLQQLEKRFQTITKEHQNCGGCQVEIDFLLWGAFHGDVEITEKSIDVVRNCFDKDRTFKIFKEVIGQVYKKEIPGPLGMVFAHHQAFLSMLPSDTSNLNLLIEWLPLMNTRGLNSGGLNKKRRDLWLWNMSHLSSPLFFLSVIFFLTKKGGGDEASEALCDFLGLFSLKLQAGQPNTNATKKQLDLLSEGLCFLIQENRKDGKEILKRLMESETPLDRFPHVYSLMEKERLYCALGLEKEKEDQGSGKRKKM